MRARESSQLILNSSLKKPRRDQISDNESVHKIIFWRLYQRTSLRLMVSLYKYRQDIRNKYMVQNCYIVLHHVLFTRKQAYYLVFNCYIVLHHVLFTRKEAYYLVFKHVYFCFMAAHSLLFAESMHIFITTGRKQQIRRQWYKYMFIGWGKS
jgi:hypothetical protein